MTAYRISDVIDSPKLLGPYFAGQTWARWRAVLRACDAEPPRSDDELALFREVAERDWPTTPAYELLAVVGRGGGKNSAAAALAVCAALNVDPHRARPGENPVIFCFATDRRQASITKNYVSALFEEIPLLRAMVVDSTAEGLMLKNRAEIIICTANHRAPRGRTIAAAIMDEACFWRGNESASPDTEVDSALSGGLGRHPGSLKIIISSAYTRDGLLYERFTEEYGRNTPGVVCVLGTTRQFNPSFSERVIERELAKDYPRAAAEFLSIWRDDLAGFIARPQLEALVDPLVRERPHDPRFQYTAFSDDAGGTGRDSSAFSIAHRDPATERIVQDVLRVWEPPFNSAAVMAEKAALAKAYRCAKIFGDNWGAGLTETVYRSHGINYEKSAPKSALYSDFLAPGEQRPAAPAKPPGDDQPVRRLGAADQLRQPHRDDRSPAARRLPRRRGERDRRREVLAAGSAHQPVVISPEMLQEARRRSALPPELRRFARYGRPVVRFH